MKSLPSKSVNLIIADPPYNASEQEGNVQRAKYKGQLRNRNFGEWDKEFNRTGWLCDADRILKDGGQLLIYDSSFNIGEIQKYINENTSLIYKRLLIWHKTNPLPSNRDRLYINSMEYIMWFLKGRGWVFNRQRDNYEDGLFHYSVVKGKERIHSTQKPLELSEKLIKIHSNENDLIYIPFVGSGTEIIGCIKNNRNFIGTEIETTYYNLAINRINEHIKAYNLQDVYTKLA
jgi:DNA modification methylase